MPERRSSGGEIVPTAADAGGNVAGAVLGALVAGPDGAVAGAVVGPPVALALRRAIAQVQGWVGSRQAERVDDAIRVAAADIERHRAEGGQVRAAFADVDDPERAGAEDIAEAVLQATALSYEQRKARYLGHLLAAIAIRQDISIADAHYMTRLVRRLSYRQLVILAVIGEDEINVARMVGHKTRMEQAIADELEELGANYALVGSREANEDGEVSVHVGLNATRSLPMELSLSRQGRLLFDLLSLDTIPSVDQQQVLTELLRTGDGPLDE
jgi:hypothetical protein